MLQIFSLFRVEGGIVITRGDRHLVEGLEDGAGHEVGACEVGVDVVEDGVEHQVVVGGVMFTETFARRSEGESRESCYVGDGVEDALLGVKIIIVVAVTIARGYAVGDFVETYLSIGVYGMQSFDKLPDDPSRGLGMY